MKIDHAALYVRDLEGARTFFETYFQAVSGPEYHNPVTRFRSYFLAKLLQSLLCVLLLGGLLTACPGLMLPGRTV